MGHTIYKILHFARPIESVLQNRTCHSQTDSSGWPFVTNNKRPNRLRSANLWFLLIHVHIQGIDYRPTVRFFSATSMVVPLIRVSIA